MSSKSSFLIALLVASADARGARIPGRKGYPYPYGHGNDDAGATNQVYAYQCSSETEVDGETESFFFGYAQSDDWTENLVWSSATDHNSSRSNNTSSRRLDANHNTTRSNTG